MKAAQMSRQPAMTDEPDPVPPAKDWQKALILAMYAMNVPEKVGDKTPTQMPDLFDTLSVLNFAAVEEYHPGRFFVPETENDTPVATPADITKKPDAIDETAEYALWRLNLCSQEAKEQDANPAGIVYEDPIAALCAACAIAFNPQVPRCLMAATDFAHLYAMRPKLLECLQNVQFDGRPFFIESGHYLTRREKPEFDLVFVSGKDLATLRTQGCATIWLNGEQNYVELYAKL